MNKAYLQLLLDKYRKGNCTAEEINALQTWLDEIATSGDDYVFTTREYRQLKQRLLKRVMPQSLLYRRIVGFSAAAAVLILVAFPWWHIRTGVTKIASGAKVLRAVLPDGSVVWLNRNAVATYHSGFAENREFALLKGEAFFEVKKDTLHPFVIRTGKIATTVKGTSFSVTRDFYTGIVKVSVVTGRVAISNSADTLAVLRPGKRIRCIPGKAIAVEDEVLTAEANGWIYGETVLQHVSVNEIANWLHTYFNVDVVNKNARQQDSYYLSFKKDITLPEALDIINLVTLRQNINFSLRQNQVYIE